MKLSVCRVCMPHALRGMIDGTRMDGMLNLSDRQNVDGEDGRAFV